MSRRHLDSESICTAVATVTAFFLAGNLATGGETLLPPVQLQELSFSDACNRFAIVIDSDDQAVDRLLHEDDDTTALVAGWERLRRACVTKTVAGNAKVTIPRAELRMFEGFLEGRLRVGIPVAWRDALRTIRAKRGQDGVLGLWFTLGIGRVYDGWTIPDDQLPSWYRPPAGTDIALGEGIDSAEVVDGILEIDFKKQGHVVFEQSVTTPLLKVIRGHIGFISVAYHNESWYLALVGLAGDKAVVARVDLDLDSQALTWSHEVWVPTVGIGFGGHGGPQFIEMALSDGELMCFGAGHQNVYIESLDLETGMLGTRFGTYYWPPWAKR